MINPEIGPHINSTKKSLVQTQFINSLTDEAFALIKYLLDA